MIGNFFDKLIPKLRQEFVLVIFLLIGYAISQAKLTTMQIAVSYNFLLLLLIVWLIKVFIKEDFSRQYKGFIVLISGLAMFITGLYASIQYYLYITSIFSVYVAQYFYLFFPLWVMLEGAFMLFILNFDNHIKSFDLEGKVETTEPLLGDFVVVALATVVLIILGDFILSFPWYLNVCLVLTVNLVVINQFGGQIEEKKIKKVSPKK
jgi:hypothetical protein